MQRLSNYFWPTAEPKPSAEAQKKRSAIHETLDYAQTGVFIIGAGSALWNGLFSGYTLGAVSLAFYLEILASGFYEKVKHDPVTAEYIITHGSKPTVWCAKFHAMVQPIAQPIAQAAFDYAVEKGKKLVIKMDELITVPDETPKLK